MKENLPLHEIEILGVKLSEEKFPAVYKWAKHDPENVKGSVERILAKEGWTLEQASGVFALLESDLSHL